jgi:hypothetical protein
MVRTPMDKAERDARRLIARNVTTAISAVLPRYGKTIRELEGPIPGPDAVLYCARESGGVRWTLTKYPEAGLFQLTVKARDNEAARYDVDPFDVAGNVYAAQRAFGEQMPKIDGWLLRYGFPVLALHPIEDAICLTMAHRAIGTGCLRNLIRVSRGLGDLAPMAIRRWLDNPKHSTEPFDGSQTTAIVRFRFAWCRLEPFDGPKAIGLAGWPRYQRTAPLRPREAARKPRDLERRLTYYRNAARRDGPRPTGAW